MLTGQPPDQFRQAASRLAAAHAAGEPVVVSDLVIAEAYHALRYHYAVPKEEARAALRDLVRSGLVSLLPTSSLAGLEDASGAGLVDRLIHWRHGAEGAASLTFDRRFARLDGAILLSGRPDE
ncbi:MAG: hypothetical protein KC613_11140 [Myxococcales bacterium]|nr:hypothetical protein [Myxococcales bacterium]